MSGCGWEPLGGPTAPDKQGLLGSGSKVARCLACKSRLAGLCSWLHVSIAKLGAHGTRFLRGCLAALGGLSGLIGNDAPIAALDNFQRKLCGR